MSSLRRVLIVPAAGRGTRLGSTLPKALVPVSGRSMLAHLAERYRGHVASMVIVVQPSWRAVVSEEARHFAMPVEVAEQETPTGMLDAVLIGLRVAESPGPDRYWITWCDQVGVLPQTLDRLAGAEADGSALVLPVVRRSDPYIHFHRDDSGRIAAVYQRREGDPMPVMGESDMGVFSLSADAARLLSSEFSRHGAPGAGTGERNFLPFIPWLAARRSVATIPATDEMEATGINTPAELAAVERFLKERLTGY